jgi:hypothetical protein
MTHRLLNGARVLAAIQTVGGVGVSKMMRRDVPRFFNGNFQFCEKKSEDENT